MAPVPGQPGESGEASGVVNSLFGSNWKAINLPEIIAERCVHEQIVNASCRACVDACHVQAIKIEDRQPGIDAQCCDGCGICAAVCPETTIVHSHNPLSIHWRSERIALFICEKALDHSASATEGVVSCIHALSIRDLVKLYASGHHRLLVCTASCGHCDRGEANILDKHVATLNSLLRAQEAPLLERVNISTTQYSRILHSANHNNTGETLSRRKFLHRAVIEIHHIGLQKFELSPAEQAIPEPIAKLLETTVKGKCLPYVPKIDTGRCTACDTCFKLCPHYALTLDEKETPAVYQISAEKCTACGICIDVCEEDAISLSYNTIASNVVLPLNRYPCRDCGIHFHCLATQQEHEHGHSCTICQKKSQPHPLFQVLD